MTQQAARRKSKNEGGTPQDGAAAAGRASVESTEGIKQIIRAQTALTAWRRKAGIRLYTFAGTTDDRPFAGTRAVPRSGGGTAESTEGMERTIRAHAALAAWRREAGIRLSQGRQTRDLSQVRRKTFRRYDGRETFRRDDRRESFRRNERSFVETRKKPKKPSPIGTGRGRRSENPDARRNLDTGGPKNAGVAGVSVPPSSPLVLSQDRNVYSIVPINSCNSRFL